MDVDIRSVVSSSAFSEFIVQRRSRTFGENFYRGTQVVGTSEEALLLGDLTSADLVIITNKDGTNFVQVYNISGGTAFAKLLPSDFVVLPMNTTGLWVKADTAACRIEVVAFEV